MLFDRTGRVLFLNQIAAGIFDMPSEMVLHSSFFSLAKEYQRPLLKQCAQLMKQCIRTHKEQLVSFCLHQSAKKYRELCVRPLLRHSHYILLLQDSSVKYQMLQTGKDYVANASHELRTPITAIRGCAEVIQDLSNLPDEVRKDCTTTILRNCQRMEMLIHALLTLAKLDYLPREHFQECDLVELVRSCLSTFLSIHHESQVKVRHNKPIIMLLADPDFLEMAIMNLLENAEKYSDGPSNITVTITDRTGQVQLSIADRGIGIAQEDIDRIFDRFYTVDKARTRKLGGAGLGLSLVKIIVQKHQGSIVVSSTLHEGTTFILSFYRDKEPLHGR